MSRSEKKLQKEPSSHSPWARLLALILTVLVCSGTLVYLVMFLINLFS